MDKPKPSEQVQIQADKAALKLIDDLPVNSWLADRRHEESFDPELSHVDQQAAREEFSRYNLRLIAGKDAKAKLDAELEEFIADPTSSKSD